MGGLLVTHGFPPDFGGIQSYLYARCLATPDDVEVVAPARPGAGAFDREQPFPIRRWPSPTGLGRPLEVLGPLAEGLRARDVEWLECGVVLPVGLPVYLLARRFRRPYAVWAHGREFFRAEELGMRRVMRALLTRARAVFANSRATAELVQSYGVEAAAVHVLHPPLVPGALDPSQAKGRGLRERYELGDRPLVLSVSRLVPRKGHEVLLGAVARAREQRPELACAIVGEGPDRERLERMIGELGQTGHVFLPGRLSGGELAQAFSEADAFALLSHHRPERGWWEGFGIVYREAGRFGLPVVATRAGGTPDAVEDGVNGVLVEPDDPAAAAKAMLELVADAGLAARLGEEGRRLSESQPDWALIRRVMTGTPA